MTAALNVVPALPLRAAIYCRISLDQTGEAQGVERQEQACRELVEREGWEVVEPPLVDNDASAFSGKRRPQYERMLDLVRRGAIDAIVAYHPDRLYRRLTDLTGLTDLVRAARVEVRTVAAGHVDLNTASGRFTAQVLGAAAEHEAARLGERVSMKLKQNAERGKAHGGWRSYGYRRVGPGELEIVPEEAEAIRQAAERILRGATLSSIVVDWNERGIRTATGVLWRPGTLSKVLRAGRIAGLREAGGEVLGEANWEPILDRPTWERVKSRITHAPLGRRPRRNLLAGMCVCVNQRADGSMCGVTMGHQTESATKQLRPGQREPRRMIACDKTERHGCGSNTAKADYVEQIVLAYVMKVLPKVNIAQARARRTVDSSGELVASIAADEQMLTDLAADLGARRIGRAEWLAASDEIRDRLTKSRRALDQVAADADLADTAFEGVTPESFDTLEVEQRAAIVRLFVDRVEIRKGRPGRNFDPSRVKVVPVRLA